MYALCLQDWTTLRGASTVATLTQPEPDWLDLTAYQDVIGDDRQEARRFDRAGRDRREVRTGVGVPSVVVNAGWG
jgi:hypothetical protein